MPSTNEKRLREELLSAGRWTDDDERAHNRAPSLRKMSTVQCGAVDAARINAWAETDPSGIAPKLLARHYRPQRGNDDVVSISSDGSDNNNNNKSENIALRK